MIISYDNINFLKQSEKLCEKDNHISYLFVSPQVLIWNRYTVDSQKLLNDKGMDFPYELDHFHCNHSTAV